MQLRCFTQLLNTHKGQESSLSAEDPLLSEMPRWDAAPQAFHRTRCHLPATPACHHTPTDGGPTEGQGCRQRSITQCLQAFLQWGGSHPCFPFHPCWWEFGITSSARAACAAFLCLKHSILAADQSHYYYSLLSLFFPSVPECA